MRFAYFDCFSGAAGDMIVGSMLSAGLDFKFLSDELQKLNLEGYELSTNEVIRNGISSIKFDVTLTEKQPHRGIKDIRKIIEDSNLEFDIKNKAIEIFDRLGTAESKVHGKSIDTVHFHEVGGVDAIIDICGAVIGLKHFNVEKVYSSALPLGRGFVKTDHGMMPVPAPATIELLKNFPVANTDREFELTTPTGAAVISTLAETDIPLEFRPVHIGYGAGSKKLPGPPNLLRFIVGETVEIYDRDKVLILETNIDRGSAEIMGGLISELLENGALDAFIIPVTMKKNRPGYLLSVICDEKFESKMVGIIFKSGITLGLRKNRMSRIKLARTERIIECSAGNISVKIAEFEGQKLIFPEYDHMTEAMKKSGKSYDNIYFEIKSVLGKEI